MEQSIELLLNGIQMRKLYEKLIEPLQKEYGLRKIDMKLLYYLSKWDEKHNTAKDLNRLRMFTMGHISQSIHRMKEQKLVWILQDQEDRRYEHILLTEKAIDIVQELDKIHERIRSITFQGISEEEIRFMVQIAKKINGNIEDSLNKYL